MDIKINLKEGEKLDEKLLYALLSICGDKSKILITSEYEQRFISVEVYPK